MKRLENISLEHGSVILKIKNYEQFITESLSYGVETHFVRSDLSEKYSAINMWNPHMKRQMADFIYSSSKKEWIKQRFNINNWELSKAAKLLYAK